MRYMGQQDSLEAQSICCQARLEFGLRDPRDRRGEPTPDIFFGFLMGSSTATGLGLICVLKSRGMKQEKKLSQVFSILLSY